VATSEDAAKAVDVTAQVAQLKGGTDAQANALSELAAGGPKSASAVKDIIPLLKSDDTVIRRLAAYALCQIGTCRQGSGSRPQGPHARSGHQHRDHSDQCIERH
jgi:hypothetical protein